MCGKYFKRKHRIAKHMQIKHKHILIPGRSYQDSRHLLENPKVSKNLMGFKNHAQRSTPLNYLNVDNPIRSFCKSAPQLPQPLPTDATQNPHEAVTPGLALTVLPLT